ncbi:WD domain protein, partial [Teratosphaeriaceae sp. CCFEE 6253]
ELKGHEGVVLGVDVSPDNTIATCGLDKTIRIWKMQSPPADTNGVHESDTEASVPAVPAVPIEDVTPANGTPTATQEEG